MRFTLQQALPAGSILDIVDGELLIRRPDLRLKPDAGTVEAPARRAVVNPVTGKKRRVVPPGARGPMLKGKAYEAMQRALQRVLSDSRKPMTTTEVLQAVRKDKRYKQLRYKQVSSALGKMASTGDVSRPAHGIYTSVDPIVVRKKGA